MYSLYQPTYRRAEFQRGGEQVPVSQLQPGFPAGEAEELSSDEAYSGAATAGSPWIQPQAGSPSEMAALNEEHRLLEVAMQSLTERQRTVVEMRYLDELEWEEITEVLRCSKPTARKILEEAKAHLRKLANPNL